MRDVDVDPFSAVVHMIHAHNSLDRVGGYAPCQWAYGRLPTFDGRLFDGGNQLPVHSGEGTRNTDMHRNLQLRVQAEETYRKTAALARINRAANSKPKPQQLFVPGDLVYYRRYKTPSQLPSHKDLDGPKVGLARWYGPARVLSTETRSEVESGIRRPSQVVWLVAANRLKRCSPQQLRHCSERERLLAEASDGHVTMPWSFTSMLGRIEQGQFDTLDDLARDEEFPRKRPDNSTVVPRTPKARARSRSRVVQRPPVVESPQDDTKHLKMPLVDKAQTRPQQDPEGQANLDRGAAPLGTGSRAPTTNATLTTMDPQRYLTDVSFDPMRELPDLRSSSSMHRPDSLAPTGGTRRARSHGTELERNPMFQKAQKRYEDVQNKTLAELVRGEINHVEEFPAESYCVCAFSVDLPSDAKSQRQFKNDPARYVTKKIRANAEVKISSLTKEQAEQFKQAKQVEVQNWIRESAVRAVSHAVPAHRTVRMRWVLTFKDSGAAKARIVILGYEDPDLLQLERAAPTMTRQSRQLFLSYAAIKKWLVLKGDIKGAFLQGASSEEQRELYAMPVEELATALGVSKGTPAWPLPSLLTEPSW